MARKKVVDLSAEKCVGFGEKPGQKRINEEVSGYYLGSRQVNTGMGPSTLHVLQSEDGSNLGLWGSAQLNGKLEQIKLGTMVFITYRKKVKVPKGTMKVFDVEYDDEQTIHVDGGAEVNFSSSSSEADEVSDTSSDAIEEQEYAAEEEISYEEVEEPRRPTVAATSRRPTAAAVSSVSAEARARASALLSKKR